MSHRLWLNCLAVVLIIPGIARAGIIYVNNIVGDDRANGQFPDMGTAGDGPVATLARALQLARGTDSIAIANTGEAYLESVTLDGPDLAGTVAHPFVIEGNGAVLRGTRALPASVWRRVSAYTYSYQPYRKGHYQLVVDGKLLPEINSDPASATPPSLEPLTWCAHRGMVYFRVEPTRFIDQ